MGINNDFLHWWTDYSNTPLSINVNIVTIARDAYTAAVEQEEFKRYYEPITENIKEEPICQRIMCEFRARAARNSIFLCKRHTKEYDKRNKKK